MRRILIVVVAAIGLLMPLITAGPAHARIDTVSTSGWDTVDVYSTPGLHHVNGRYWYTECERYSVTTRCRTELMVGSGFAATWVFNNLTYLASPRSTWVNNPLAAFGVVGGTHEWTTNGRRWRSECDTASTGRGGCRSYIWTGGKWVVNNIIRFGEVVPMWTADGKFKPVVALLECTVQGTTTSLRAYVYDPDRVGYTLTVTAARSVFAFSRDVGTQPFSYYMDDPKVQGGCSVSLS